VRQELAGHGFGVDFTREMIEYFGLLACLRVPRVWVFVMFLGMHEQQTTPCMRGTVLRRVLLRHGAAPATHHASIAIVRRVSPSHVPGSRIVPRIDCFSASAPARVCVHGVGVAGVWGYPSSLTVVVADDAKMPCEGFARQCVILTDVEVPSLTAHQHTVLPVRSPPPHVHTTPQHAPLPHSNDTRTTIGPSHCMSCTHRTNRRGGHRTTKSTATRRWSLKRWSFSRTVEWESS
jgi:hypothetical protein